MTNTKMQNSLFTEYDDIVGIAEIQKMLGIGKKAALDLVKLPQIHGIKIGNKYRVPKIRVVEYLLNKQKENE